VTPTPFNTPTDHVEFNFATNEEAWQFFNPSLFANVQGSYNASGEALDVKVSDNTDSFGYWESPLLVITNVDAKVARGGSVPIQGIIGPQSLYRSIFTIRNNTNNQSVAPAFRVRSSSFNFEQSDMLAVTSSGNGDLSPRQKPRAYVQYFSQPAGIDSFRLDFDVLNFIPSDTTDATLSLTQVAIDSLTVPAVSGTTVASYDFSAVGPSGFTERNASPLLDVPVQFTTVNGLGIRGADQLRGIASNGTIFGYWGAETDTTIAGDALYAVQFTVRSSATSAQRADVPVFRMRVNETSLKYSAIVSIDSRDGGSRVPVDNVAETYVLWMQAVPEINNEKFILSFDYLCTPESGDDPSITLVLESLNITRFAGNI